MSLLFYTGQNKTNIPVEVVYTHLKTTLVVLRRSAPTGPSTAGVCAVETRVGTTEEQSKDSPRAVRPVWRIPTVENPL